MFLGTLMAILCLYVTWSNGEGQAIVISPSGDWDGADGPWSSFVLGVGAPNIQTFRGFPSSSQQIYYIPLQADWCNPDFSICEQRGFYETYNSSSWKMSGLYKVEGDLDLSLFTPEDEPVNTQMGLDTITWGESAIDIQQPRQFIGLSASMYFPLALFGVYDGSLRNIGVGDGIESPISSLYRTGLIPSRSFSYTAGSFGRKASASLILGGYDASRKTGIGASYVMPSDHNHSLILAISGIEFKSRSSSISANIQAPIVARIDSAVPQLFLPLAVCQAFESAFGLMWNDTLKYYIVNETAHRNNIEQNTSVVFSIAYKTDEILNITFPYSAFDLNLGYPIINTTNVSIRYFPLRRPLHEETYVLGRAFLQETYIVVDYGRSDFTISKASCGGNSRISPILTAPNMTSNITGTGQNRNHLPVGAYVGIGVGSAAIIILLGLGMYLWWRNNSTVQATKDDDFHKAELHGEAKPPLEAVGTSLMELETIELRQEAIDSHSTPWELEGSDVPLAELEHANETRLASL